MAKTAYSKLKLKVNEEIVPVQIGEVTIGVKKYLPVQEKLALIGRVIELAHDLENNYSNPVKVEIYTILEVIKAYTDITFTEKQEEDIPKLYDQFISSGAWDTILEAIPENEYSTIQWGVTTCIESIYKYRNSVLGILDSMQTDYEGLNFDIEELTQKIGDPNTVAFVKDVLTKIN
jgi:hypothetical protein